MRILVIISFLIAPLWLQAQNVLKGTVLNQEKEALAFVNILINNDTQNGVFTDIDGHFEINSDKTILSLQLTYIGYQALDYQLNTSDFTKENFTLILEESSIDLIEAVVIAGENPAHRIIRKVVENRKANNPEKWPSFQCDTYNKMTFEFLPNMKAQAEKEALNKEQGWFGKRQDTVTYMYNKFAQKRHLAVMETLTEKSFLAPNHHKELVLNNRVSGFTEPQFVALAKDAQPFSFYETYIDVLDQNYLNPISIGSTNQYFFEIKDTLYQQQDSVFIISFQPKKGKTFDGLKGVLYINTNQYALQNVIAEPSDVNKTQIKIEQKYTLLPEGKWFPEQLNFEWMMPKYPMPHLGLKIVGKSYISNVDLKSTLKRKEFTADKYTLADDVYNKADSIWTNARIDELSTKEQDTYVWMDSVSEAKNIEAKFKLLESLVSRKYQVNKIDIDLPRLASFNEYESVRLGFGFHTNDKFNKRIKLGGYIGYGFRDEAVKYGGDVSLLINKKRNFLWKIVYQNDLRPPGIPEFPQREDQKRLFGQALYFSRMDTYEDINTQLEFDLSKNVRTFLKASKNTWTPNYEYSFLDYDVIEQPPYNFTELSIGFRWAYDEQYVPFMGARVANPTKYPIVQMNFDWSIRPFEGQFRYRKLIAAIEQTLPIRKLGRLSYRIEGGWLDGFAPYAKLFTSNGIGPGFELFAFTNTFQTMAPYEFISDKFVHVFFEHNFGVISKKSKISQPEFSIVQNFGIGSLSPFSGHYGIEYDTLEKGFLESGFIIDNLLRLNYINIAYIGFGAGVFYRYGAYHLPQMEDNFAYRLTVDFNF